MDLATLKLKGLEASLGPKSDGQISHGLNLVLKLKDKSDMWLVLVAISQAQRKIDAGLIELNFVHFARFLPTYDNTALQVITEFDGPLDPYVLDFAIEIGDVFDTLLGFTEGTDHIVPIAAHPAEFLAFVVEHNTVTVPPRGPIKDWSLFAAYPQQTVLEITGPRTDLPIPKADRWTTPVERQDIQGNILKGYRAARVKHFVLRVLDASKARAWLVDKATPEDTVLAGVPQITSFKLWDSKNKPKLMLNIGLTYAGMNALEIRESWRAPFPEAFRQGALERAEDNFDVDGNAPKHWWLGGPAQAHSTHVVVSLYQAPNADALFAAAVPALTASMAKGGFELLATHDAFYADGVNWFGYADGIANPRVASACPVPHVHDDLQPAVTAGEFLLGPNYKNIYGGDSLGALPAALATNGSFCAVRVLAQDTKSFGAAVKAEAARLQLMPDLLAAKLMGRWYKGAPLSLDADAQPPPQSPEHLRNDFDYAPSYEYPDTPTDHVGDVCPVGAHIRRSNPRTARVAGARYTRRLMRRGMHYENVDNQGRREVGLFGMFMCADLERQFEFIQRQWINGDRFAAGLRGTRDPFAGTPETEIHDFDIPMSSGPTLTARLPQFVYTKGSLYLFMPGLKALSQLEHFATTDAPVPVPPMLAGHRNERFAVEERSETKTWPFKGELTEANLFAIALAIIGRPIARTGAGAGSLSNLRFDPRRRDFQMNPFPVYAAFRASERVHYSPLYDGWFVFGYDDVLRVCTEDDNFSAAKLGDTDPRGLFTLDVPEHTEVRNCVAEAWLKALAHMPTSVEDSINRALAAIGTNPCFDLVDDFARPVPRDVYFDFLGGTGIEPAERMNLDRSARTVMKHHDNTFNKLERLDGLLAARDLQQRFLKMLAEAYQPNSRYEGSFVAYFARLIGQGNGALTLPIALVTLINLTVAGYMSVEFLLATGIRRLLLDGAAGWETVKKYPASVPLFLAEMRRTEHALSVVDRFTKQDVVIGGVRIPADRRVFGVLASANRDELVYGRNSDEFDPYRVIPRPHLGLGWGTHECMGRMLEKDITEPTLLRLSSAMPKLRLQSAAQPPWFQNFYFRSFDHLAVTLK